MPAFCPLSPKKDTLPPKKKQQLIVFVLIQAPQRGLPTGGGGIFLNHVSFEHAHPRGSAHYPQCEGREKVENACGVGDGGGVGEKVESRRTLFPCLILHHHLLLARCPLVFSPPSTQRVIGPNTVGETSCPQKEEPPPPQLWLLCPRKCAKERTKTLWGGVWWGGVMGSIFTARPCVNPTFLSSLHHHFHHRPPPPPPPPPPPSP